MARNIILTPGEFYHIYNRGVDKRMVFLDDMDHDRFTALLYLCNSTEIIHVSDYQKSNLHDRLSIPQKGEKLVSIGAYCLMPNHFHILLREEVEGGTSLFMQKVSTAYTMYFNKKYERTGALFEGRFKAQYVGNDDHLKYLFAYIHLNPVKLIDPKWKENRITDRKKAKAFLYSYAHSSFADHCGANRQEKVILSISAFPKYFQTTLDFKKYVDDWIQYDIQ